MADNTPIITQVSIAIVWTDPERGIYKPVVGVSGPVPDDLSTVELIKFFIQATHEAMHDPSLALD